MAAHSGLRSRVTAIATCPICLEDFKDPRSLPCVHSFCLQCLQGHCKDKCPGDDVPCPLCRKEFQIPQDGLEALPHNFFLQNLVDAKTTDTEPRASRFDRSFKERQPEEMRGGNCDKHDDKRLVFYCFDCKGNICTKCLEGSHKHHSWNEVEKVAKDFAASIQSDIKPFPSRISQFHEAVKRVQLANQEFLEKVKSIKVKVQTKGDEMKRLVDDHTVKLMQELDEAKTSSVKETKTRVDGFELAVTALESFEAYSSQLTSRGSARDITRAANDLHARANELLKTYVTSSSDCVLPDIEFLATSVEKITGGQNIIGSLMTSGDAVNVPAKTSGPKDVHAAREKFSQSDPQIVHTFPEAELVRGVTLLNNELYVLRAWRYNDQVDVYSTTDFTLLRRLNVSGLSDYMMDITSCVQKQCVYIADDGNTCIHRVGLDKSVSKWPVSGEPYGLSLTRGGNLLVTCWGRNGKLVELSSENGKPVREITLQSDTEYPQHSIQLANNQYVVCHGAVSLVGSDGRVIRSHSGDVGLAGPRHMAADDDEFVFVADDENKQIVLLDPSLKYVRHVLQHVESVPCRLCFDDVTRRLYVCQSNGIVSVVQL